MKGYSLRHRNIITHAAALIFLLCVFCVSVGKTTAQDFTTVHDGVEYAQVQHKLGSDSVKINLLRLNLKKIRLDVKHAMDMPIGTERTSSIATRHNAVAAINAGFFRLDNTPFAGEASGVLKIDGRLLSETTSVRIALAVTNDPKRTSVAFEHVLASGGLKAYFSDEGITLDGINREPKPDEVILFTTGATTPKSSALHYELILRNCIKECEGELVIDTLGAILVPENGFVVVLGPRSEEQSLMAGFYKTFGAKGKYRILDVVGTPQQTFHPKLNRSEDIVAGIPQLIKDGKIDITWEQEKASRSFVETRHPRTAVAKLKDGKFLMITVDGRQPGVSVGMSLQELAEYLLSLGAVDAMNLDGGGSTTMFLDGKVVNTPSDKEGERKVGDAILVTLRKRPSRNK